MKLDINNALRNAIKTGKVVIGSNRAIEVSRVNEAKLIVLASNCPPEVRAEIEKGEVPVFNYTGQGVDLGIACGKPYVISALAVIDPGKSEIMAVLR